MKTLIIMVLMYNWISPFSNPEKMSSLTVEISDLRNTEGEVGILIFKSKEGYPEDHSAAFLSRIIKASDQTISSTFESIPAGTYVVTIMHDENANGKLDKSFFGQPLEGYGVSNNPKPRRFGPPDFEKGKIVLGEEEVRIQIKMRYDD